MGLTRKWYGMTLVVVGITTFPITMESYSPTEEGLQLDDPISEKEDAEKEVTILTYVDHSFEQDLTFIDGLVKTRSRSFLSDPSQLEFEKVLT